MKVVYLVRHAEPLKDSYINYLGNINNQEKNEKIPLSINGDKKFFDISQKIFNQNINKIYSSSYERAISTAKHIAYFNHLEINVNSAFNERRLGKTEGIKEDFWLTQLYDENAKTIGGESRKEVRERMMTGLFDALNDIKDGESLVLVSHATAITFLLMNWCKLESANLVGKVRHLTFKNETVINDSFNTPEIFKLMFDDNNAVSIDRIIIN